MWQNRSLFTTVQYSKQQEEMWQNRSLFTTVQWTAVSVYTEQQDEMWQNRSLFTTVQYNSKMKCDKIEVYLPLFNTTARWNVTK